MYRDQRVGVAKMEKRGAADIKGEMLYDRRRSKKRCSIGGDLKRDGQAKQPKPRVTHHLLMLNSAKAFAR